MSEKMTAPLPCPFCGSGARKISKLLDERFGYALEVSYGCPVCGFRLAARGDSSKGGYADNRGVEEAALRKWNTRANDASREAAIQAAVEAEREECKQACEALRGTVSMFTTSKECRTHNNAITCCVKAISARGEK